MRWRMLLIDLAVLAALAAFMYYGTIWALQ